MPEQRAPDQSNPAIGQATLGVAGKSVELPVVEPVLGQPCIDIGKLP